MKKEDEVEALPEVTQRDWQIYLTTVGLLFASCFVWPLITDTLNGYPWRVAIVVLAARAVPAFCLVVWMRKKGYIPEKKEEVFHYFAMLFFSFAIADKCVLGVMEGVMFSSAYKFYTLGVSLFAAIHCFIADRMARGRTVFAIEAIGYASVVPASVSLLLVVSGVRVEERNLLVMGMLCALSVVSTCVSLLKLRRYLRMAPTSGLNRGSYTPTRLPKRVG